MDREGGREKMNERPPSPGMDDGQTMGRGAFLRQMWLTLLAAVGLLGVSAAFPKEAFAAGTLCRCTGGRCSNGQYRFSCYNSCTGNTYNACLSGGCYNRQYTC
jgi:hypothetical protein